MLEREIILILGLMGQFGAIGFVLTAKSLARFRQLEDKEFAEKYPEQLKKFIDEYNESVAYTSSNIDETAQLIAEYGIVASEAIAKKALPKCHIVCYINNNMRSALEGFLQVLYDQNPKSVGGSMPKDDFYYEY